MIEKLMEDPVLEKKRFPGSRALVVGLARSGQAVARLLLHDRYGVLGTDCKARHQLDKDVESLFKRGLKFLAAEEASRALGEVDFVVASPGVSLDTGLLGEARERGLPVLGELEAASRFCRNRLVAFTGTNGKSTSVSLLTHMLNRSGRRALATGNIGYPLSQAVLDADPDTILVVEVSSFQLEAVERFKPGASCILNVSEDHLDRHKTMGEYVKTKCRIFMNQVSGDSVVLNSDDPFLGELRPPAGVRCLWFGLKQSRVPGAFLKGGKIVLDLGGGAREIMDSSAVPLPGPHNLANALACVCVCGALGLDPEGLAESMAGFAALEHRLETVGEYGGVLFVNDSKATNVDSLRVALETFDRPIVLIAGGVSKGADFSVLRSLVKRKARLAVLIGEARERLISDWEGVEFRRAGTMREAVETAARHARPGDVVLLSPGCASFDMFRDFEERGRVFKELVRSGLAGRDSRGGDE